MTTKEMSRAADAVEQISVDTEAVVIAIKKGNGQIVVYNCGDLEGRKQLLYFLTVMSNFPVERSCATLRKEEEA